MGCARLDGLAFPLSYDEIPRAKKKPQRANLAVSLDSAMQTNPFQNKKRGKYPIGLVVKVRMISGTELEGQIIKIETTALGTFLHVEYDDGVINVTSKQILDFYDFCPFRCRPPKTYR
jgi:hypothetical protein